MRKSALLGVAGLLFPMFLAHAAALELTSPAFRPGTTIPVTFTCRGKDVSPPLSWADPPSNTASFALIMDDPDAPAGTWVHWVIWNIPAAARSLDQSVPTKETLPDGAAQGINDFTRTGYGGPCPPSGTHRYFFKLYALDTKLKLPATTTKSELEKAMQGHILGQAGLIGKFGW